MFPLRHSWVIVAISRLISSIYLGSSRRFCLHQRWLCFCHHCDPTAEDTWCVVADGAAAAGLHIHPDGAMLDLSGGPLSPPSIRRRPFCVTFWHICWHVSFGNRCYCEGAADGNLCFVNSVIRLLWVIVFANCLQDNYLLQKWENFSRSNKRRVWRCAWYEILKEQDWLSRVCASVAS